MPTLEWIGKDKVINHHQEVPFRVLERKYSFDENGQTDADNGSENMIIRGDNLEALKALLPRYEGRVKCIYIDPPYNTGNEGWVYNDNVNDPKITRWLGEVVGKEGEDLTRHDKWLCMMYPRLKLLYKLLSNDGAIFVSLDYHEQPFLRILLDEIFGATNLVSEIACVNKPSGRSDDKYIATAHESIIIYRKSSDLSLGGFDPDEKITKRYNKVAADGRLYREEDLRKRGTHDERTDRPNLFYPFFYNQVTDELIIGNNEDETPDGFIRIEPMKSEKVEGTWRWGQETAMSQKHYIHPRFMPNKGQWSLFEWQYLDERETVKPTTVWDFKDVNSERGTEMFIKCSDKYRNRGDNMKLPYQNELYELRKWIDNVSSNLPLQLQFQRPVQEINSVCKWISVICVNIQGEYPFYASLLPQISNLLFTVNNMGMGYLNPAAFGELVVVIRHIEAEPVPTPFWKTVHKRIVYISAGLYEDGHYAAAAEKAVKEVEARLREKFAELKPNVPVPSKVGDIIGALLSENGIFKFCDTSDTSGKNYRRGICALFEGTMAAYRNPSSHANLETEKREALEQIMLASQLMFVLDKPQI